MIAATRTRLLQLREHRLAVDNCRTILKGRRQALIKEFLDLSQPLLRSREELRDTYAAALEALSLTEDLEGRTCLDSLARLPRQPHEVTLRERNLLGLRFREVEARQSARRTPPERGYDYLGPTVHLDEAFARFEELVDELCTLALYEGKFRRLAEELLSLTRRIRVLENRVLPALQQEIRAIDQYLAERDRESYYRLKRFKEKHLSAAR